jgi:hypothetical protein
MEKVIQELRNNDFSSCSSHVYGPRQVYGITHAKSFYLQIKTMKEML